MKIFTTNNIRLHGMQLIKGLIMSAALIVGVILVFSLGSVIGEIFTKLLN